MNNLLDFSAIDVNNIIFSDTFDGNYNNKYIPIGINIENDEVSPLVLTSPPSLYTKGIRAILDRNKENTLGYYMKISLFSKKRVTEEEKKFVEKLDEILKYTKEFLRSIPKDELNIDDSLIENMQIVEWAGVDSNQKQPLLYSKLMMNRRTKKVLTQFFDENSNTLISDPESQKDASFVTCALKFENISISERRINFEVKLIEVLQKKIQKRSNSIPQSILKPNVHFKREEKIRKLDNTNKFITDEEKKTKHENQNKFKNLPLLDDEEDATISTNFNDNRQEDVNPVG